MPRNTDFQTVHTEGGLLPADQLSRIATGKADGIAPTDYGLPSGEKVNEAISQSWARLCKHWADFQQSRASLPEDQPGTDTTNQKWLLPLFASLGYGRLTTSKAPEIDGKTYPITRYHGHLPIHFVGCNIALDKRSPGVKGAATGTPHGLVQEFLNRTEDHLWAFVSNGRQLRILRDNVALSRQSYIEFDLESMFDGEVYSDFAILWMVCHVTRTEGDRPELCWLEKWSAAAREHGTRVLENLRIGVEHAIEALGRGFISHPANDTLRQKLRDGQLDKQALYHQVLRTVYRLLFLFVAEDRDLLHPPGAIDDVREVYDQHYSTRRLRDLAGQIKGSRHGDLWHVLSLTFAAVSGDDSAEAIRTHLGLPALGSRLWRIDETPDILGPSPACPELAERVQLSNDDLLDAIRHLAYVQQEHTLQSVNYRDLGSEELGSVYESLLELQPDIHPEARKFELRTVTGSERKTTGSYYTPDSLVQCLLDSALEPVIKDRLSEATGNEAQQQAILDLTVCDPACGSGHFLIGAAHRLARHLSRLRAAAHGEAEPTPDVYQHALRDVIAHCIYGVDINPMAVELCKVSLWLEALDPGRPLAFLDHHIQCGNSLLGTTPALIAKGIPDDAFKPIEGDDKEACKQLKAENKSERKGQRRLWGAMPSIHLGNMAQTFANIDAEDDSTPEAVAAKEKHYQDFVSSAAYENARFLADAWCAAFVWEKTDPMAPAVTTETIRRIEDNPHEYPPGSPIREGVRKLANQYQFFHWHLVFPDVFRLPAEDEQPENEQTGWSGGFDCVLGNPPFVGGLKISELYGDRMRHLLNNCFDAVKGKADLCSLMIRRGFDTLAGCGRLGMIASNTIGQGQTRETGLAWVLLNGGHIAWAHRYVTWPGTANVEVTLIVLAQEAPSRARLLDDEEVPFISSRLDTLPEAEPHIIPENRRLCFQGSIVLGKGFVLDPSEAARIIADDPKSAECLFPYLTGEDINTHPSHKPSRWVIQFDERCEEEAREYELLWALAEERIFPERKDKDARKYPRMVEEWWKHWNNRKDLYEKIRPLGRAMARSRVSEFHMLAWVRPDIIYSDACVVFAFEDDFHFAVLQSGVHEVWLRREASTMRTDVRYTPTDCLSTFPFPRAEEAALSAASQLARTFYEQRQQSLAARSTGFTQLYNLVHNPDCADDDVQLLRQSIVGLDRCVLELYGWLDISCERAFESDERGRRRYLIPQANREEIIRRLTHLNLERTCS